ncbi:ribosome hibernation-promoting factor, HPF/YfiA family [Neomegalonema perideroedes]|uniref:ribosome hibernation-promoting factor, HPF/YfiA family n=1 Tax=Neomegalonema perideroedes TaxID=217219 RepID=UPI00037593ED|nr:ribosome-associated translation inhibitor RaiA [Neomegalonema perideroedes]
MRMKVTGRQIDVGDSLPKHVEEKILAVVTKYADEPLETEATFSRDAAKNYRSEVTVKLSTGLTIQAEGRAADIYPAFEQAAARVEKQVRRHKRRLKAHSTRRKGGVNRLEPATSFILTAYGDDEAPDALEGEAALQPVVVAEAKSSIPSLTVGEAVLQMEMADEAVLMFRNEAHGELNVVYRRPDGHIGWIDPKGAAQGR